MFVSKIKKSLKPPPVVKCHHVLTPFEKLKPMSLHTWGVVYFMVSEVTLLGQTLCTESQCVVILLMVQKSGWPVDIYHYLQGFIYPRWWSPDFWTINSSVSFIAFVRFHLSIRVHALQRLVSCATRYIFWAAVTRAEQPLKKKKTLGIACTILASTKITYKIW